MEELRKQLEEGLIDNKQYEDAMMKFHRILMDYSKQIADSHYVQSILIQSDGVFLEIVDEFVRPCIVKMQLSSETDSRCASAGLLDFPSFEEEELRLFRKITDIAPPKSFFDIGANEGWYSFHFMKKFLDINCYSFEPIPETYKRAEANLRINGLSTEGLYNFGLSDTDRKEVFYFNKAETGAASMRNLRGSDNVDRIECELRTLDGFVEEKNIDSMDFIKCDVEGSEIFALKGGYQSIKKFKPIIFCEMLRKWCAKFGYHPNDIINLLKEIGYCCYFIQASYLLQVDEITEETEQTNFFFLHSEKHHEIINQLVKK